MSWGYKLLFVFIAFAGLMSYMVYRCIMTPVDLVTSEYYRDELVFQKVIDGSEKANALSSKVLLQEQGGHITVQLPGEMKNEQINGSLLFYCPSDAAKDRKLVLQVDATAKQQLDVKNFLPGNYLVKIQWENKKNHYYTEQPFRIL